MSKAKDIIKLVEDGSDIDSEGSEVEVCRYFSVRPTNYENCMIDCLKESVEIDTQCPFVDRWSMCSCFTKRGFIASEDGDDEQGDYR